MSKVILIILDGYGYSKKTVGNAILKAKKPFIDSLRKNYPTTLLKTSGSAVGLPHGYMGNSEVGHFTIGAGRTIWQSQEAIDRSIENKTFFKKPAFLSAVNYAKKHQSSLHLMGMISDKGVHAHVRHLLALLDLAKTHKLKKVFIHCFTDGRDVPEKSAKKYLEEIIKKTKSTKTGQIASIIGRYYAMDRDTNWNRTKTAYDLIISGQGKMESDPLKAIDQAYKDGADTDYYIKPIVISKTAQATTIKPDDAVIFFNFRTDRAKQLTDALTDPAFKKFPVKKMPLFFVCLGPYSKICPVVFPAPNIKNNLGSVLAKHKLKQLRIAETEKYAHVTFFFNSQVKKPYPGEDRILIPSLKVPSYGQKPAMSAPQVTSNLVKEIKKNKFEAIILNFANGDLVGHSGELKPTIKCIEVLDDCLKKIIPLALKKGYDILMTADHGNAEQMFYPDGQACPAHTVNPVECTLISAKYKNCRLKKDHGLKDIAPTMLDLLNIKKPKEMTGESLIIK